MKTRASSLLVPEGHRVLGRWMAGLAVLALAGHASATDWRQYRGPSLDGHSAEKLAFKQWPVDGLKTAWKIPFPNGFSSFVVADGKAYSLHLKNVGGAAQEVLAALDAGTGRPLWSVALGVASYGHDGGNSGAPDNKGGDGPRSTPSIDGDRVYVLSSDLLLLCLDAATGKAVWRSNLPREHGGRNIKWENAASPVIDGQLVFVAGGGPGQALMAFNKASGEVVWKGQDDLMTHSTPTVADIHGVRQVIFFTQEGLASLEAATGRLLWRYSFPFRVSTAISPVVAGDLVYCSAGYGVGAGLCRVSKQGKTFQAQEVWRMRGDKPLANHWSTPVLHDGHLYGMFQFKEYGTGPLKCVHLESGRVKWEQAGFGPGNVIFVDGHLLVLSDDGHLVLVQATPSGYVEKARTKVLKGKCWSTPVLSDGRVYVRSTLEAACIVLPGNLASQ